MPCHCATTPAASSAAEDTLSGCGCEIEAAASCGCGCEIEVAASCGCGDGPSPEAASTLERLVMELDQRVRKLAAAR